MAIKGQPGQQLKLLMSAREIQAQYQPWDEDRQHEMDRSPSGRPMMRPETDEEVWDRKLSETNVQDDAGKNMYRDLLDEGVRDPISLSQQFGSSDKPQVGGGHHRIAVMAAHKPDALMPVMHYDKPDQPYADYWDRYDKDPHTWSP